MSVYSYAPFPSDSGVVALRVVLSGPPPAENVYPSYVFCLLQSGSVDAEIEGRPVPWAAGQGKVIPPFSVVPLMRWHSPETVIDVILFPAEVIDDAAAEIAARPVALAPFVHEDPSLLASFAKAHAVKWRRETALARDYADACLAQTAAAVLVGRSGSHGRSFPSPLVRRTRALIEDRYAENIRLEELAQEAGVSKFHFLRQFRRQVGMAPHAYQIAVRIARARELLALGHSGAVVADRVGFYDQSAFTRAFKRAAGITPGAYAALVRPGRSGSRLFGGL
jgi:AraC-like DNA-binding protein